MQDTTPTCASGEPRQRAFTVITADPAVDMRREVRRGRRPKKNAGLTLFWGISGGSAIGAVGFVLLTLYQQYDNSVTELQRDVKHFNESCADLVKKEEIKGRFKTFWELMDKQGKELNEKSQRLTLLEHDLTTREEERKQLAIEVQRLRERMARLEGQQAPRSPEHELQPLVPEP